MSIQYHEQTGIFSLETAHSLYQMKADTTGVLLHLYYGEKTGGDMDYLLRFTDRGFSGNPYELSGNRGYSLDTLPQEYSGSGVGDFRLPSVQTLSENGSRSADLRFAGYTVQKGREPLAGLPFTREAEDTETLTLTLRDSVIGLEVQPQIISVYKGGRPSVTDANAESRVIPCDVVIMAIGQDILSEPFAEYDVDAHRKTFMTTNTARLISYEKIFAGGDCVFGPSTVIQAVGAGKVAAINIDEYLGYHHKIPDTIDYPEPKENDRTHIGRVNLTERSARERKKSFDPVENGMSFDEAMQECRKCLRCDHFGCGVVEGGRV